jgi:hypothetical protein
MGRKASVSSVVSGWTRSSTGRAKLTEGHLKDPKVSMYCILAGHVWVTEIRRGMPESVDRSLGRWVSYSYIDRGRGSRLRLGPVNRPPLIWSAYIRPVFHGPRTSGPTEDSEAHIADISVSQVADWDGRRLCARNQEFPRPGRGLKPPFTYSPPAPTAQTVPDPHLLLERAIDRSQRPSPGKDVSRNCCWCKQGSRAGWTRTSDQRIMSSSPL